MGHGIIRCDECSKYVIEGSIGIWECDCGWKFNANSSVEKEQVGGTHYLDLQIQPWDAMKAWLTTEEFTGFLKGNVIKYMARDKNGLEDLKKARHYLDKLIEVSQDEDL